MVMSPSLGSMKLCSYDLGVKCPHTSVAKIHPKMTRTSHSLLMNSMIDFIPIPYYVCWHGATAMLACLWHDAGMLTLLGS